MADILASVVGEWSKPILISLFVVLLFALNLAEWPTRPLPEVRKPFWRYLVTCWPGKWPSRPLSEKHRYFWERIGLYGIFTLCICLHVVTMGMTLADILLTSASGLTLAGWLVLLVCSLYAALFFRSLRQLVALRRNALRLTRVRLLSYPLFCLVIPWICFVIISFRTGEAFSLQKYAHIWPLSHFWGSCIIAMPWLFYFILSSELKNTWHTLNNQQNGGHGG